MNLFVKIKYVHLIGRFRTNKCKIGVNVTGLIPSQQYNSNVEITNTISSKNRKRCIKQHKVEPSDPLW